MPTTFYTETEYTALSDTNRLLRRMIEVFEDRLTGPRSDQSADSKAKGHYPFIAYHSDTFIHALQEVLKMRKYDEWEKRLSFLDIGCGIGTKVLMAGQVLNRIDRAFGLEYDKAYLPLAHQLCGKDQIIRADGVTWDGYGRFDILYMYCPINDHDLQRALQRQVIKHAKTGATLIMAGCEDESPWLDQVDLRLSVEVYTKRAKPRKVAAPKASKPSKAIYPPTSRDRERWDEEDAAIRNAERAATKVA